MTPEERDWLAELCRRLEFVRWDRLTQDRDAAGELFASVYGWIGRDDGRSDFVSLTIESGGVGFTTSSAKWSHTISDRLYGASVDNHVDCERVQDVLGDRVPNHIRL